VAKIRGDPFAPKGNIARAVEALRRLPFHREPRIARRDFKLAGAPTETSKAGAGNSLHLRVDLVEAEVVSGAGIVCQGPDP